MEDVNIPEQGILPGMWPQVLLVSPDQGTVSNYLKHILFFILLNTKVSSNKYTIFRNRPTIVGKIKVLLE